MEINATSSTIWHYKAFPLHALNFVCIVIPGHLEPAILVCSMYNVCNPQPQVSVYTVALTCIYIAVVICSIQHILEALLSQLISS